MLLHVVLYRWKPHTTQDKITKVLEGIQKLKEVVPGIRDIYSGENIGRASKGYTHAVVVLAEDEEALAEYKAHPLHQTILGEVDDIKDEGVGVDFVS
jgi:hypothetical protein